MPLTVGRAGKLCLLHFHRLVGPLHSTPTASSAYQPLMPLQARNSFLACGNSCVVATADITGEAI